MYVLLTAPRMPRTQAILQYPENAALKALVRVLSSWGHSNKVCAA